MTTKPPTDDQLLNTATATWYDLTFAGTTEEFKRVKVVNGSAEVLLRLEPQSVRSTSLALLLRRHQGYVQPSDGRGSSGPLRIGPPCEVEELGDSLGNVSIVRLWTAD